jgi:hypothetical protein
MPTRDKLIESLDWTTARVSDRVWSISAGVVAVTVGYFVEAAKKDGAPFLAPHLAAIPAAVAIVAVCCDLAQYLAAYGLERDLLEEMRRSRVEKADFDANSRMYRRRRLFYVWKIRLCLASAFLLTAFTSWRVVQIIIVGRP